MAHKVDENSSKKLIYQSFSTSYKLDRLPATYYYCKCDYCIESFLEINNNDNNNNNTTTQSRLLVRRKKSFSSSSLDKLTAKSNNLLCFYYYNKWQSELYKCKGLEKQNEKLTNQINDLQTKLDHETQQQVKISLEWRKTVTHLVDENRRLITTKLNL
jgi:hypothetical protein